MQYQMSISSQENNTSRKPEWIEATNNPFSPGQESAEQYECSLFFDFRL